MATGPGAAAALCLLAVGLSSMHWVAHSQQQYNEQDQLGYACSTGSTSCQAYASYRALQNDTILSVGQRFGLSAEQVSTASSLSGSAISTGQVLLIPLNCSCVSGRSQYNTTYVIQSRDTFYLVSTNVFQGLTTYQAVQRANPSEEPTKLEPGDQIIFPIRCSCPSATQAGDGVKSLVTYGVQADDTVARISALWNISQDDVSSGNTGAGVLLGNTTLLLPAKVDPPVRPTAATPVTPAPPPQAPPPVITTVGDDGGGGLSTGAIVGITIGSVAAAALGGLAAFCLCTRKRRVKMDEKSYMRGSAKTSTVANSEPLYNTASFDKSSASFTDKNASKKQQALFNGMAELADLDKPTVFPYSELLEATNELSPANLIQGSVYRGMLRNQLVAIKEMKDGTTSQELKILAKVHHSNLVRLIGISTGGDKVFLVYEYAENGSLSSCLHGNVPFHKRAVSTASINSESSSSASLSWNARLQIALDVATGLEYIHAYTQPSFIHKNIKSSNILLDSSFRAKISNFGMARLSESTDGTSIPAALTKHIAGTQGYMAPEYLEHGLVSTKVDVYAFGVVLLELITGREAILADRDGRQRFLHQLVIQLLDGDEEREAKIEKLKAWVDPALENAVPWETLYSLSLLARSCVDDDPSVRPSMKDVTYTLGKMLESSLQWETEEVLGRRYKSAQVEGR